MRLFKSSTLSIRLTKVITLLTFFLFVLFSLVTFFVAYSLEDAMFNQQLQQANKQQQQTNNLPINIEKISNLSKFDLTLTPSMAFDKDALYGEFSYNNKHYHYMRISDGLLLMDVTEQGVVKRGAKDIILILILLLIPCIAISFYIAKSISTHALKPFHRLSQYFQQKNEQQTPSGRLIDIEEEDVKVIAQKLEQSLAKQALLIKEQVAFNQGMSHEIRTPLQIMSHSLELLATNHSEFYHQPLIQRLVKSLARIKRISNALLWLTSKEQHKGEVCVNSRLEKVRLESQDLVTVHHLDIALNNPHQYQPKIAMPEEVLELIFFNLINNAIHHGMQSDNLITLIIKIDQHSITFSNQAANIVAGQQNFSLGLKLIKELTKRFNYNFVSNITDNQFNATLYFD